MYDFKFHPKAQKELEKLNNSTRILFTKKLKQILNSPQIGLSLGNKNNLNLSGFKKVYFSNKKYRIIYEILENKILIHIIAIGKQENIDVYKKANERID